MFEEILKRVDNPIRYHNITHDDMKNGSGLRVVLWLSGCTHQCKECHNPITWSGKGGILFDEKAKDEFYKWLGKSWTEGCTISGGDPLHPTNRNFVGHLLKDVKEKFPNKSVWLYTGYELAQSGEEFSFTGTGADKSSFTYPYLEYIDVLVDGRFSIDVRNEDIANGAAPKWRGSSNQRLIDVSRTIESKNIIEWEDN